MIDLQKYDSKTGSEDGRWFEPIGLDGKKIGIKIKLLGPDSKKYALIESEIQREIYMRVAEAQSGQETKEGTTQQEKDIMRFAKLTLAWEPLDVKDPIVWGGEPFNYSEANALKLYEHDTIIRAQVKMFCEARTNFLSQEPEGSKKQ